MLSGLSAKAAYLFGILTGVAVMSLIGFVIVATIAFRPAKTTTATTTGAVAGATDTNTAPTQQGIIDPAGDPSAIRAITKDDHQRGPADAPITLIEYTDFQCPFCSQVHPTLARLMTDYPDKIRLIVRNFPLEQLHPQARPAANAAECVAELSGNDAFWKFADTVFANQSQLSADYLVEAAIQAGAKEKAVKDCIAAKTYDQRIATDQNEGSAAGVSGTPATFVNGKLISGALPYEQFKAYVDSIL